jgi:NAD(P)H-dependent FMN reductase
MNILAFGASNSGTSINQQLATTCAMTIPGAQVTTLPDGTFEAPLYREDLEATRILPATVTDFLVAIARADALIISHSEHNGSFNAAYKNLLDWASRVRRDVFLQRPTLLLATSTGSGGAKAVLAHACEVLPALGADVIADIAVPNFHQNYCRDSQRIIDTALQARLERAGSKLVAAVQRSAAVA